MERRPKVLSPEQAAGPLRAHTLGVNEVGISFLRTARERVRNSARSSGGTRSRIPSTEVAAPRRMPIADAVLSYVRSEEKDIVFEQRFVEVDRGHALS